MKIISAVRNFDIYQKFVKDNPFNQKADFVCFDNRSENLPISKRYNSFLENYDYASADWFVFCHEDWEVKENLSEKLQNLDKNFLYGPIGAGWLNKTPSILGNITHSAKDGSRYESIGAENCNLLPVLTFDCQCLIVHSSLVSQYKLRFDENLLFDLYVEDFCINAFEKHKIESRILQLKCHHWSRGNINERFEKQFLYLKEKYKKVKKIYFSVCNVFNFISGSFLNKFVFHLNQMKPLFKDFIFKKKVTKSGKLVVKICKIPVPANLFKRRRKCL